MLDVQRFQNASLLLRPKSFSPIVKNVVTGQGFYFVAPQLQVMPLSTPCCCRTMSLATWLLMLSVCLYADRHGCFHWTCDNSGSGVWVLGSVWGSIGWDKALTQESREKWIAGNGAYSFLYVHEHVIVNQKSFKNAPVEWRVRSKAH